MTLIEYHIDYSAVPESERHSLIKMLESISYIGFSVCPDLQDHPRIRGEHKRLTKSCSALVGSPPHTRGTPKNLQSK